jgi:hypothetical protein
VVYFVGEAISAKQMFCEEFRRLNKTDEEQVADERQCPRVAFLWRLLICVTRIAANLQKGTTPR